MAHIKLGCSNTPDWKDLSRINTPAYWAHSKVLNKMKFYEWGLSYIILCHLSSAGCCHYAKCRYAECRGAFWTTIRQMFQRKHSFQFENVKKEILHISVNVHSFIFILTAPILRRKTALTHLNFGFLLSWDKK
jgi:hypothetical protein